MNNAFRLYFTDTCFVQVDSRGYVSKDFLREGAFGCVVKVFEQGPNDPAPRPFALKFPRLLEERVRENFLVLDSIHSEMKFTARAAAVGSHYLMLPHRPEASLLQYRRRLDVEAQSDLLDQNQTIIIVNFSPAAPPRFVAIKLEGVELVVTPPEAKEDLEAILPPDHRVRWWAALDVVTGRQHFSAPAYFRWQPHDPDARHVESRPGSAARAGRLVTQAAASTLDDPTASGAQLWFAGLPSLMFRWAEADLQRDLVDGLLGRWEPSVFVRLFERLTLGIIDLHKLGHVHGDIRPANVLRTGTGNGGDDYYLADFGGFAAFSRAEADAGAETGNTLAGPSVGVLRTGPFYAPERCSVVENELADTALPLKLTVGNGESPWVLVIGWRTTITAPSDPGMENTAARDTTILPADPSKLQPAEWILEACRNLVQRGEDFVGASDMAAGDRVRVRDLLFSVKTARYAQSTLDSAKEVLLVEVESRYGKITDGRLVVLRDLTEALFDRKPIPLASYTEFHGWSAATDVYALGAIILYSRYFASRLALARRASPQSHDPRAILSTNSICKAIHIEAEELIRSIASPEATQVFARPLWECTEQLSHGDRTLSAEAHSEVKNLTMDMTRIVPRARELLECLDWRCDEFLWWMRIGMRCLQRQHVTERSGYEHAFCRNRFHPVQRERDNPENAVTHLWHDLRALRMVLTHEAITIDARDRNLPAAEDGSYLARLQSELATAKSRGDEAEARGVALSNELDNAMAECDRLRDEQKSQMERARANEKELGDFRAKIDEVELTYRTSWLYPASKVSQKLAELKRR